MFFVLYINHFILGEICFAKVVMAAVRKECKGSVSGVSEGAVE